MANPFDEAQENPQIPTWRCDACQEVLDVPRRWVKTKNLGYQIIINWNAMETKIKSHMSIHERDLINGLEDWLDAPH